jgi:hypothetical protein
MLGNKIMNCLTLRRFWIFVQKISSRNMLMLNDVELVNQLISQFENEYPLTSQENYLMRDYIRSKTLLIRDLVEAY